METLTSKHLEIPRVGSVGKNLCWAEVGYSIGEYYAPGTLGPFCGYVSGLLGREDCCTSPPDRLASACDHSGDLSHALMASKVHGTPFNADWDLAKLELEAGRPLLLAKQGSVGHCWLVVGLMEQDSWKGFELIDPKGHDWRQLYLWPLYSRLLETALYSQLRTEHRDGDGEISGPLPAPSQVALWADDNLQFDHFEEMELPEAPAAVADAVASLTEDVGPTSLEPGPGALVADLVQKVSTALLQRRLPCFPLLLTTAKNVIANTHQNEVQGHRCFLSRGRQCSRLVVDVFKQSGGYVIGRFSAGKAVDRQVSQLESALRASGKRTARSLYFEEWMDLGLGMAFFKKPRQRERVRLFGPRGYLNLGERRNEKKELDAARFREALIAAIKAIPKYPK